MLKNMLFINPILQYLLYQKVRVDCSDLEILLIDFEPKLVKLLSEVGFACHRYLTRSPSSEGVVRSDFDRFLMWIHSFE